MPSIKDLAKGGTMHAAETLVKDSKYIPEDKFAFCPMGCAKTAEGILREVAGTNGRLAGAIAGKAADEGFAGKVEKASGLDTLGQLVMESAKLVCDAIDAIAEADLEKPATMPWGASFPLFMAIFLPSQHMTYHDGQINYIQTLLGDSTFHWAE